MAQKTEKQRKTQFGRYTTYTTAKVDDLFEFDPHSLDEKIADFEDEISKAISEIANMVESKYAHFVPHLLGSQELLTKTNMVIEKTREKCEKLTHVIKKLEKDVDESKESPDSKMLVINNLLKRLKTLSSIEECLSSLWVHEISTDPLTATVMILQLEEYAEKLQHENDSTDEIYDERIIPSLKQEIFMQKSVVISHLDTFFKQLIQFPNREKVDPSVIQMEVSSDTDLSNKFTAMDKLDMMDVKLQETADALMSQFCDRIIHSANPKSILSFRTGSLSKSGDTVFIVSKHITRVDKPIPNEVFESLTTFFTEFHRIFNESLVDKMPFLTRLGQKFSNRLIDMLVKDCLTPSIPYDKRDEEGYRDLIDVATGFYNAMKGMQYFTDETVSFEQFINNYDQIFINRRCLRIVTTARDLITQPYMELTQVGSNEDDNAETIAEFEANWSAQLSVKNFKSGTHDAAYPKLFQFRKCTVSTSTFKLVQLLNDTLVEAAQAETELAANRLFTTAQNLVKMFLLVAPRHHEQEISTVPQIAAIFFNNCHYILHRLMTMEIDLQPQISQKTGLKKLNCSFVEFFAELRHLAADALEHHLVQSKRQISSMIGSHDVLVGLNREEQLEECNKVMNGCLMHIEQVAKVWKEVFAEVVLARALGTIISHLLNVIADIILNKEDITAVDADRSAAILTSLLARLKETTKISGKQLLHTICEESYFRLNEIILCLKGTLQDIMDRWCEGKGPLALWLKASQVKQLVRALFQNTDRRAFVLSKIN